MIYSVSTDSTFSKNAIGEARFVLPAGALGGFAPRKKFWRILCTPQDIFRQKKSAEFVINIRDRDRTR